MEIRNSNGKLVCHLNNDMTKATIVRGECVTTLAVCKDGRLSITNSIKCK